VTVWRVGVWEFGKQYEDDCLKLSMKVEINSIYPCEARFHHEVISSAEADFIRRMTDLT